MAIHGKDCFLSYQNDEGEWVVFGGEKTCSFNGSTDMQECASPDSGASREYVPMKTGWTMAFEGLLLDSHTDVMLLWRQRRKIVVRMKVDEGMAMGNAYITSVNASGTLHEMGRLSLSLQGTGPVSFT
jgi:predicted secreted protein